MRRALAELNVGGVRTSAPAALAGARYRTPSVAGDYDTHFLESLDLSRQGEDGGAARRRGGADLPPPPARPSLRPLGTDSGDRAGLAGSIARSALMASHRRRSAHAPRGRGVKYYVDVSGKHARGRGSPNASGSYRWSSMDVHRWTSTYESVDELGQFLVLSYGHQLRGLDRRRLRTVVRRMTIAGHFYDVHIEDERERAAHQLSTETPRKKGGLVVAVMPGVVVEVLVAEGDGSRPVSRS